MSHEKSRASGDGAARSKLTEIAKKHSPSHLLPATARRRRHETPHQRQYRWRCLPYGFWIVGDERVVLFNRRYQPLVSAWSDGRREPADPTERIPWSHQCWLYLDRHCKTHGLIDYLERTLDDFVAGRPLSRTGHR